MATKESKQTVQKIEPARSMSPFDEMERMFEHFFSRGLLRPLNMDWTRLPKESAPFQGQTPSVDVIDRDKEIVVKAELPGVDKDDLDISLTQNTVTIKVTTSLEEKEEDGDFYRCEMSRGSYARTLSLPADVDDAKAKAKFKNGILKLTLPKLKTANRTTIKVD